MKDLKSLRAIKIYLNRYASGPAKGLPEPDPDLFLSVVIPAYKEENLRDALNSLLNCEPPGIQWEILVHVNHPDQAPENIIRISLDSLNQIGEISKNNTRSDVAIHAIYSPGLPVRHAGVGLARKIGMDTAVDRFYRLSRPEGIVVAFDADAGCSVDYLREITRFYLGNLKAKTANVYFEHPLTGSLPVHVYDAIRNYELYLRYYRQALSAAGHPHAIYTVGSSFTVRASAYSSAGGMGRHRAGEDFYFLHKCILLGNFYEINSTTVFPSARESDRVLFGTGASITKQIVDIKGFEVYNLDAFLSLRSLFFKAPVFFNESKKGNDLTGLILKDLHPALQLFLKEQDASGKIAEIADNTGSVDTFVARFFAWFNGLMVLRYLNEVHREAFNKRPVTDEANRLAGMINMERSEDTETLLKLYRDFEKSGGITRIT